MQQSSASAGTVLAFARSMGEFGATLFFAGNYAGVTQTIPIAIYFDWMAGDKDAAIFWVGVVILISFLVILFVNTYSARTQKWKKPAYPSVLFLPGAAVFFITMTQFHLRARKSL